MKFVGCIPFSCGCILYAPEPIMNSTVGPRLKGVGVGWGGVWGGGGGGRDGWRQSRW